MAKRRTRFVTWCKRDIDDERKINYRFTDFRGSTMCFTSEDYCEPSFMHRLRNAWIKNIELINNEWFAELYEGD